MTIEQQVVEKLRELPPEKQKEVLDFVNFLKERRGRKSRFEAFADCGQT